MSLHINQSLVWGHLSRIISQGPPLRRYCFPGNLAGVLICGRRGYQTRYLLSGKEKFDLANLDIGLVVQNLFLINHDYRRLPLPKRQQALSHLGGHLVT